MNSRKYLNPFALGGVVTGKQFAGRSAEVARLRAIAEAGQHVFVFAPRRYGKTSLLREALETEAISRRLVLVWCDCLPTVSEACWRGWRRLWCVPPAPAASPSG
jgi:hypothetical protein